MGQARKGSRSQIHYDIHLHLIVVVQESASSLQYKPAGEIMHCFQMHCVNVCIDEIILGAVKSARNQSRI